MLVVGGESRSLDKCSSCKDMSSHRNLDSPHSDSLRFASGRAFYASSPLKNHGEKKHRERFVNFCVKRKRKRREARETLGPSTLPLDKRPCWGLEKGLIILYLFFFVSVDPNKNHFSFEFGWGILMCLFCMPSKEGLWSLSLFNHSPPCSGPRDGVKRHSVI